MTISHKVKYSIIIFTFAIYDMYLLFTPYLLFLTFSADYKLIEYLGFSRRGVFIGEGAASKVDRGGLTHRGRDQGLGHAALVCGHLVAPLRLLFGSL
jgi:hypothetical protein